MNTFITLLIFSVIGASIGWVTNKIALYFLFHPKRPKKFLFWTIQGIFPKRQNAIAERFSAIFVQEFFTSEMIHNALFSPQNLIRIFEYLDQHLSEMIQEGLNKKYPILSMFISESQKIKIRNEILELISLKLGDLTANFESKLSQVIDIQGLIRNKINALDSDQVNGVMQQILNKELRFIELSGAILGGIIGLIQGLLTLYLLA